MSQRRSSRRTSRERLSCCKWHARSASDGSSIFRRTKFTATCRRALSPMRIRQSNRAARIPRPRQPRTCWFAPTCARMDFRPSITRSSNNYGPYQFPEKFLPLMITNALDDKPLPIYGDGKQQRDWLHVEDNCRGILAVLERGRIGEVYNIGGLDVEENLTIVRQLLQLMGKPESLLSYVKDRPGHDRRYALRCKKMEDHLGWKPTISLDEGLRQTIEWYKANGEWLRGVREGRISLLLREIL